jgi:hypothetical protein
MSYKMVSPGGPSKGYDPQSSDKKAGTSFINPAPSSFTSNLTDRKPESSKNSSPIKSSGGRPGSSIASGNTLSKGNSAKKKRAQHYEAV